MEVGEAGGHAWLLRQMQISDLCDKEAASVEDAVAVVRAMLAASSLTNAAYI